MPIYEYTCLACGETYEKLSRKVIKPRRRKCPECGGPAMHIMSSVAIRFKGPGFYVNDYKRK